MNETILVLSFGDLSRQSGYRTRVLGELRHLDARCGLTPHLLLFDRNPDAFQLDPETDSRYTVIARNRWFRFFPAVALLAKLCRIRVVHAHNLYSAALALALRWRLGYRVVLDYHGRIPEEYVYLGKGGRVSRFLLERLESWCVRRSDHVIAVSDKLGQYLMQRYRIPSDRITVIPCCADPAVFYPDPARRSAERQRLGLDDRFLCAHVGSFSDWYQPEDILQRFLEIRSRHPEAHLLIVTRDVPTASSFLSQRLSPADYTVLCANHDDVPALLNAADLGLLLLKATPNIETSSPTKFAEYVNCGLPVLISEGVGDFSSMVRDAALGTVVSAGQPISFERPPGSTRHSPGQAARMLQWDYYNELFGRAVLPASRA